MEESHSENGELNRDMFLLFILRKVDTLSGRNITAGIATAVYAPTETNIN